MDRKKTSIVEHAATPDGAAASRPGRRAYLARIPRLRWLWLLTLCLALGCWTAIVLFGSADLDAQGILHEPLFGLIPIGFSLLFVALLLAVLDAALSFGRRR